MIELPRIKEHKGTLKQARLFDFGNKPWVEGLIYGHPGFRDGDYIHTSSVVEINGNEIETRNSRYTVEWAPSHAPSLVNPAAVDVAAELGVYPEQVEDSPITPSVPLEVVSDTHVGVTVPDVVFDDGLTRAMIVIDQNGAPAGEVVVVTRQLADGSIFYNYGMTEGFIADPGTYRIVSGTAKPERPDQTLITNIAEQFVVLFDHEELRHADIAYFADAFKSALRG